MKLPSHYELAEIENALAGHPQVSQAAVALHGDPHSQQLVAYIVSAEDSPPETPELRRHLSSILTADMVPDVFVMLDRLPLTTARKLDREALAKAARGRADTDSCVPAIIGGLVADVADIWREVLHVDSVDVNDDLFSLGGHSLTITRMAVRIRSRIGVDVPLTVFYDTPTVPGITSAIEALRLSSQS